MKNKKILGYVLLVLLISIVIGFIYGINNNIDISNYIKSLSTNNNMFLNHFSIIFIFLIFTISLLGILFGSIYLCFEGMSIGYILSLFFSKYKLNGIIYFLYILLINKLFFLIILLYLFYISYKYFKLGYSNLIGNSKDYFINIFKPLLLKYFIVFISILIYDTFLYFLGNKILSYLIK